MQPHKQIAICAKGCCVADYIHYTPYPTGRYTIKNREGKAGCILYNRTRDQVVLVQSCGKKWGFPKGTKESGESYEDCAYREVYEEVGVRVSRETLRKSPIFKIENSVYYLVEIPYTELTVQSFRLCNDANSVGWVSKDCIAGLDINLPCKHLYPIVF
jgi:8-oxo-dGTP pyrophosphatase MutT (NUDIX family)